MVIKSASQSGRAHIVEENGIEVRDRGDGKIMPAAKIARRNYVFHSVAILEQNGVVEIMRDEHARDDMADERGEHEAGHDSELVSHFENDQNSGHGRLHDGAEAGAHPADREQE